jgi:hypothetical protein
MGWLFGKKKIVPKVPFPEGKPFNEKTLQFPNKESGDRVIVPEHIQAAAGLEKPVEVPEEMPQEVENKGEEEMMPAEPFSEPVQPFAEQKAEPLFVRKDIYQQILGELHDIKSKITELKDINKDLDDSEYNEEKDFLRLKSMTKVMHDRLLQVDKIIFKGD